jgi:hypothetical protein
VLVAVTDIRPVDILFIVSLFKFGLNAIPFHYSNGPVLAAVYLGDQVLAS